MGEFLYNYLNERKRRASFAKGCPGYAGTLWKRIARVGMSLKERGEEKSPKRTELREPPVAIFSGLRGVHKCESTLVNGQWLTVWRDGQGLGKNKIRNW